MILVAGALAVCMVVAASRGNYVWALLFAFFAWLAAPE